MKRFNLAVLSVAAVAAMILAQGVRAQAQKDLATLIQGGETKQALERIRAGADINQAQLDGTSPLLWAVNRADHEVLEALLAKKADPNVGNEFGALPLTEAARLNDMRMVKALLEAGAKVDTANPDGETVLMLAIKNSNQEMFQTFINAGANVSNVEKFHNQTPLMYAAASGRDEMVKILLAKGADVKPRAMYFDWPSQVTSEPRTQYRSVGGLNALMYAVRGGCYSCVEQLVAAGADVNVPTPEGITPLMLALDNSQNGVAKFLMDKGANLHVWDWWGRTPLWIAVDRKAAGGGGGGGGGGFGGGGGAKGGGGGAGKGGGAKGGGGGAGKGALGGAGGPVGGLAPAAGGRGNAPVVSSMEIINALLDAGADPNPEMNFHRPNAAGNRGRFQDNQVSTGTTPLFRAVQLNDLEVIQALIKKGANPNINSMGFSAWLYAAGVVAGGRGGTGGGQANRQFMELMLQNSADVNTQSNDSLYSFNIQYPAPNPRVGVSALHAAAQRGDLETVKFLLDHGANPNLLNGDGKKPIDLVGTGGAAPGGAGPGAGAAKGKGAPAAGQGKGVAPAAGQGKGKGGPPAAGGPGGPGGGALAGGGGRGGANAAATEEIRAVLQAAAAKQP